MCTILLFFELHSQMNFIFFPSLTQGRIHSIGLLATNFIDSIYLWNRTESRAQTLANELNQLRSSFKNPNVKITNIDSLEESVKNADVIVTATFTSTPLLFRSMIKNNVHINGILSV